MFNAFKENDDEKLGLKFAKLYPNFNLYKFETELREGALLCAFCCHISTGKELDKKWRAINSYVSALSLDNRKSEFERWNSYLIFVCDEEVETPLKYEIENDKFAMRKIVEQKPDGWDDEDPGKALIELLNNRLLLTHIDLSGYKTEDSPASPVLSKWGQNIVDEEVPFDPRKELSKDTRSAWIREALERAMSEVADEN
ncbi:MAG: ABC-three component system middle component 1 [Pontiella sp.]